MQAVQAGNMSGNDFLSIGVLSGEVAYNSQNGRKMQLGTAEVWSHSGRQGAV